MQIFSKVFKKKYIVIFLCSLAIVASLGLSIHAVISTRHAKQRQIRDLKSAMNQMNQKMYGLFKAQNYHPEFIKLEHMPILDSIDSAIYNSGKKEMRKHKAVITGIARDNAEDLAVMMRHIEALGELFADYRVIIFENDSKDGTKEILATWRKRNPKVAFIMKDFNNTKRPSIQFLADARNYYLNEFLNNHVYNGFDLMIPIDMDMAYGIDLRGVEHAFSLYNKWDMVCANGIFNAKGQMYDMFAFRSAQFNDPYRNTNKYHQNFTLKGQQQVFKPGDDLYPIYSGFGGMAIYKREFLKGCAYESIKGDCEHLVLHECMRKKNARLFLDPALIIRYSHFEA